MVYLLQIKISLRYFFYADRIILLETLTMMIKSYCLAVYIYTVL